MTDMIFVHFGKKKHGVMSLRSLSYNVVVYDERTFKHGVK